MSPSQAPLPCLREWVPTLPVCRHPRYPYVWHLDARSVQMRRVLVATWVHRDHGRAPTRPSRCSTPDPGWRDTGRGSTIGAGKDTRPRATDCSGKGHRVQENPAGEGQWTGQRQGGKKDRAEGYRGWGIDGDGPRTIGTGAWTSRRPRPTLTGTGAPRAPGIYCAHRGRTCGGRHTSRAAGADEVGVSSTPFSLLATPVPTLHAPGLTLAPPARKNACP